MTIAQRQPQQRVQSTGRDLRVYGLQAKTIREELSTPAKPEAVQTLSHALARRLPRI